MCHENATPNGDKRREAVRLIADLAAIAKNVKSSGESNNMGMKLHASFQPGPLDVICQRGKNAYDHNQRFRDMISKQLERYSAATSKLEKSLIVSDIVDGIREASPQGGFVRKEGKYWYRVQESVAREKVGGCFRDLQLKQKLGSGGTENKKRHRDEEELTTVPGYYDTSNSSKRMYKVEDDSNTLAKSSTTLISVFGRLVPDVLAQKEGEILIESIPEIERSYSALLPKEEAIFIEPIPEIERSDFIFSMPSLPHSNCAEVEEPQLDNMPKTSEYYRVGNFDAFTIRYADECFWCDLNTVLS